MIGAVYDLAAGVLGVGAEGRLEAPRGEKVRLTKSATTIFNFSNSFEGKANPLAVRATVKKLQEEIQSFQQWDASWFGPGSGVQSLHYLSSNEINSRLQQALENAMIAEGSTSPSWRPQTKAFQQTSVVGETIVRIPEEVKKRSKELLGLSCLQQMLLADNPVKGLWNCLPVAAKVGTVVLGGVVTYGVYRRVRG